MASNVEQNKPVKKTNKQKQNLSEALKNNMARRKLSDNQEFEKSKK